MCCAGVRCAGERRGPELPAVVSCLKVGGFQAGSSALSGWNCGASRRVRPQPTSPAPIHGGRVDRAWVPLARLSRIEDGTFAQATRYAGLECWTCPGRLPVFGRPSTTLDNRSTATTFASHQATAHRKVRAHHWPQVSPWGAGRLALTCARDDPAYHRAKWSRSSSLFPAASCRRDHAVDSIDEPISPKQVFNWAHRRWMMGRVRVTEVRFAVRCPV